LEDLLH